MLDANEMRLTAKLFHDMVNLCDDANLPRVAVIAVLAKILVLLSLEDETKEEMLSRLSYVYDVEKFMKPDSKEIH